VIEIGRFQAYLRNVWRWFRSYSHGASGACSHGGWSTTGHDRSVCARRWFRLVLRGASAPADASWRMQGQTSIFDN
jgi:hypothetical protein